jgi:ABC-type sugar transport system substrate-binding protein
MDDNGKSAISRRGFVRLAGIAGAGGVLAACGPRIAATEGAAATPGSAASGGWAQGVKITYSVGGGEGDSWGTILLHGAQAATADLGADTAFTFEGWDQTRIEQSVREAIAQARDAIVVCWLGTPDTLMAVAQECADAGIVLMLKNVDYPTVREAFPGVGYVGVIDEKAQGWNLGEDAWAMFGPDGTGQLHEGDHALVMGSWEIEARAFREGNTLLALESHGVQGVQFTPPPGYGSDYNLVTAPFAAAILGDPLIKVVVFHGPQVMGNAQLYLEAADKGPGEILCIGTGLDAKTMDMFEKGWVQLASDAGGYLMGYHPIISVCLQKRYAFLPLLVDTYSGNVTQDNYQIIAPLVLEGIR